MKITNRTLKSSTDFLQSFNEVFWSMTSSEQDINRDFTVSPMADSMWQALSSYSGDEYFLGWLQLQCGFISGSYSSVIVLRQRSDNSTEYRTDDNKAFAPVAVWPDTVPDKDDLFEIVDNVIAWGEGLVVELERVSEAGIHPTRSLIPCTCVRVRARKSSVLSPSLYLLLISRLFKL